LTHEKWWISPTLAVISYPKNGDVTHKNDDFVTKNGDFMDQKG
jgi:hypothetical protein